MHPFLENTERQTYSDIDRAIAIKQYLDKGYKATDVATMMGLGDRPRKMIESLLKLPDIVQQAVDNPQHPLTTKHAIYIPIASTKYPAMDVEHWVRRVRDDGLSVNQMVWAINKTLASEDAERSPRSRMARRWKI